MGKTTRGQIGRNVGQLVLDMRRVMEPFTARSLKVRKKNVLKDFVAVVGPLGITHFSILTKTENSINMSTASSSKFTSASIQSANRCIEPSPCQASFFVVDNLFHLNVCHNTEEKRGVNLSDSEAEQDGDHIITELPQVYSGHGNIASQQTAVRLTVIGPRMTLQLVKIVEGMGEGKVLYHSFVSKTEEELQEILNRKEARLKEKEERKRKQEQNIALKKRKTRFKKRSLEGIKRKRQQEGQVSDDEVEDPGIPEDRAPAEESEDEAEYYRQDVGRNQTKTCFLVQKGSVVLESLQNLLKRGSCHRGRALLMTKRVLSRLTGEIKMAESSLGIETR